jgi:hypothetical protein
MIKSLTRLDSISPELADSFRRATDRQRRNAAFAACAVAVKRAGLAGEVIEEAFSILRNEGRDSESTYRELSSMAALFDEEYFKLRGSDDHSISPEALSLFRKARAASALALALHSEGELLHESIYEAAIASNDRDETLLWAAKALGNTPT